MCLKILSPDSLFFHKNLVWLPVAVPTVTTLWTPSWRGAVPSPFVLLYYLQVYDSDVVVILPGDVTLVDPNSFHKHHLVDCGGAGVAPVVRVGRKCCIKGELQWGTQSIQ